jgi:MFS family permease
MNEIKIYGYRWIVLLVFALVNATFQMHWLVFAPITSEAAAFYGVTPIKIGMLSMCFMIMFIVFCIPASHIIDTYGFRVGVGIGVVLTAIFGLMRGVFANDFTMVFIAQCGIAVAQPFITNATTRIGAAWFPIDERATEAGLATLSQYIGFIIALAFTPFLLKAYGMKGTLMIYGVISAISLVVFFTFFKEKPPTPPSSSQKIHHTIFAGINHILRQHDMIILIIVFFIGLGMFNAVTTWIEQILSPRGFNSEQAGITGAAIMIGGILGAIILPILSDKFRARKPFIILAMIGIVPGLLGLTVTTNYSVLLASGFVLGFFIMSAGPIGFQYGAEISYPASESTSQGLLLLAGQIGGIIFIFAMDKLRSSETGAMTPCMIAFVVMSLVCLFLGTRIKESHLIKEE